MILVTGATGFVGGAVVSRLTREGRSVIAGVRKVSLGVRPDCPEVYLGDLLSYASVGTLPVPHVDAVVHTAARVHVMNDANSMEALEEYRRTNVEGTIALAHRAARSGVRRFVFVSSIKVNGESTDDRSPFTPADIPAPQDPYGVSKKEAETALLAIARETGMEVVIIRPPLVYGPGVKANFATMMQWVRRGWPLPLGAVTNRRSFVALDNLVDLIVKCIDAPEAVNQIFMVSDGQDLSTTDLLKGLARAMDRPAWLIPVPHRLLVWGLRLVGRGAWAQRLCGNLQVDISHTRRTLGWAPPVSVEDALRRCATTIQSDLK